MLADIEQEGLLRRTHGGVVVDRGANSEPSFSTRALDEIDQKVRIGKRAATLVEEGDHIIIDSGTTTIHIAKHLHGLQTAFLVPFMCKRRLLVHLPFIMNLD